MKLGFAFIIFILSGSYVYGQAADSAILRKHLLALTKTEAPRTYKNTDVLNGVADYIKAEFSKISISVSEQVYYDGGVKYRNIICSFDTTNAERIIIGAHYDVCGDQQGADDNASGVAGLLELARLLKSTKHKYRIDLVAYTLEEPPYFRTNFMGSYVHAKYLHDNKIKVKGMISLEMIGYFSDEKNSQDFPMGFLKLFYGNKGNFITIVRKFSNGSFCRKFTRKMKKNAEVRTKSFKGPTWVEGVDYSDHLNYWLFGYSALMITDTSFLRNKNYHEITDTIEKLDLHRMAGVVDGVYKAIEGM